MKELAIKEAKKLRKFAKPKEIERLNEFKLNPNNTTQCIYGQMTGDCYSDRSFELIKKCAERVYKPTKSADYSDSRLNGTPHDLEYSFNRRYEYHSPIEILIFEKNMGYDAGVKILKYLKGETKKLEL
jgi:hypothetical protein